MDAARRTMTGTGAPPGSFARRFARLYLAGLLGIATLPIALVPLLRLSEAKLPMSVPAATALALIQPAVLLAAAVALGCTLAHKLQLKSLIANAADVASAWRSVRPQLIAALALGAAGGAVVLMLDQLVFKLLMPEWFARAAALELDPWTGLVVGVLYGGIAEELLLRWGLMTLLAWALWKLLRRRHVLPGNAVMLTAVLLAAVLFGLGHLPAAAQIAPLDALSTTRVLLLNFIPGVVSGWLFWRWHLEAAMLAHMGAHLAFFAVRLAGLT
jgi:membrane protease YdiL (CAAX protease family)